ncbi:ribokinase [Pseudonocardia nematodicida]|uniref:Ribokinase n=1 Tax=Pseudonocardia nematodicida TaxID=1206997 RepID=A0ABV1K608_9PSEU
MSPSRNVRVLVVGSINEDVTLRVASLPRPGETVLSSSRHRTPGGKGANQAVAAVRAGADVTLAGRVGDDESGARMLSALRAAGVDTRFVGADTLAPTGRATVLVSDDGENAIVVASGANATVSGDVVRPALRTLAPGDVVVAQAEVPRHAVAEVAGAAATAGARFVLNLAPFRPTERDLVPADGFLVLNLHEAASLAADTGVAHGAAPLAEAFGCSVVVTLGPDGALLATPGGAVQQIPALTVAAPVDTTGAGDAFVGVFAAELAGGRTPAEAARRACTAAGLSVTTAGTQSSFVDRSQVDAAERANGVAGAEPVGTT